MPSLWLLLHGRGLFEGLLLGAAVLGALAWFPLRRARGRRAVRRHPRLRARPADPGRFSDGAAVTVLGTLEAAGPPCPRFEDGAPAAAASIEVPRLPRESVRAARLCVRVDGVQIGVEGAVDVVCGSSEWWARWPLGKLPRPIAERAAAAGLEVGAIAHGRSVLRTLAPGDVVRAAGRLQACAADRETGEYRTAARRWRLVGEEPGVPVALAAAHSPRLRRAWLSLLKAATLGAFVLVALAGLVGEQTYDAEDPSVIALAAATPFRREAALGNLASRVRYVGESTPAMVGEALTLAHVPRYCDTAAEALLSAGEPERAARLGERCRSELGWSVAARGWSVLGDLERASAAAARARWRLDPRAAVRMHVLAGALGRAVDSARAAGWRVPACLSDALQARAGDRSATDRLALAVGRDADAPPTCVLLLADLLSGPERTQLLALRSPMDPQGGRRHPSPKERLSTLLLLEAAPPPGLTALEPDDRVLLETNPERLVLELETELFGVPSLERTVLARLGVPGASDARTLAARARLAASQAALESIAGRDADARGWIRRAVTDLERIVAPPPARQRDVAAALDEARGLRAAIELRAGSIGGGRRALEAVAPNAWFAPVLRRIAAEGGLQMPRVPCAQADAPANHCGATFHLEATSLWWRALVSATMPTAEQLVSSADLARLLARSARPRDLRLARALRRRTAALREALLDRERGVLLAVLDSETEQGPLESDPYRLEERVRQLAADAHPAQQRGWLSHGDTRSLAIALVEGRCKTFVVETDSWGAEPSFRVTQPVDGRVWTSERRTQSAAARVCPTRSGDFRVDVTMGRGSGRFALSWF